MLLMFKISRHRYRIDGQGKIQSCGRWLTTSELPEVFKLAAQEYVYLTYVTRHIETSTTGVYVSDIYVTRDIETFTYRSIYIYI